MRDSRDLLVLLLLAGLLVGSWPRPPPSVGPPAPPRDCPVVVEGAEIGVGCLTVEDAARASLRAGDRLRLDGDGRVVRERMAPARLSAWRVPVDVNRASLEELASLDGIGPRLAERIAAARPFSTVDELAQVRGLGGTRLARLRDRVLVTVDANEIRGESGVDP